MNPVDGYTLIENSDRIIAQDKDGVEICGAYHPAGHDYWQFYVTQTAARLAAVGVPPHKEHFSGGNGKRVVKQWIIFIANLYSLAALSAQHESAVVS